VPVPLLIRRPAAIILACTVLPLLPSAAWAEGYLCAGDKATGFAFNPTRKEWNETRFRVDSKYLIRRKNDKDALWKDALWVVVEVGESVALATCNSDFTEWGTLVCDGMRRFIFNQKNMRFQIYYQGAYIWEGDGTSSGPESTDTPYIEIGRCSPI
jgi:hypothetical protein